MPQLSGLTNSCSGGLGLFAVFLDTLRTQTARLGPDTVRPNQGGSEKGGSEKGGSEKGGTEKGREAQAVYSVCVTSTYKVTRSPG